MAFSKARRLSDLVSSSGEISSFVDGSITTADLHTNMDLTSKTVLVATQSASDNDTSAASTAYVTTAIADLVDSSPSTLNTLNELAAALGDDANFSTTITNSIATKLPLAGGTLTGDLTLTSGTSNKPKLTITNTNADDTAPQLILKKDSASPADNDEVGRIYIYGDDDAGNATEAFLAVAKMTDVSNGSEDSSLDMYTYAAGGQKTTLTLREGKVGVGTSSPRALLDIKQSPSSNRTSKTGTARGVLHLEDGDTPGSNEITAITFESNSNNAASIIGNALTNSGSQLFFGTSNAYNSGVTNTALVIDQGGVSTFNANIVLPSSMIIVGDIKAVGVGGLALQTDEGTKRIFINDDGKVGISAGGVIYASRFSVGKPPSRTPGSVFTGSPSSFFSEATLGNSKGDDQKIVTFAGEDQANVSGLALYRYRRVAGTNWTGDGFSFRQEVDNTANIYDYMNFAGGKVGIGTVTPDEFDGRANNLVVQDTGDGGITIVSGDSSDCRIAFTISADTGLSNGAIHYDNNDDSMHFSTGGSDRVLINNTAAKGNLTVGYHGATANNSAVAFHGVTNDATLVVSNSALTGNNSSYGWAGRGGRYLHSNGTGWVGDGSDPAIVIGSSNSGSNRSGIGIALHNESQNDDQYSPMIVFGNKSNSGSYNTAYATIVGEKKGGGVDANWSVGELHFDTAGIKPGGGNAYMKDEPAMTILTTGTVRKPWQPFIRARGNNASMVTNQGTNSNPFDPSWYTVTGRGITESGGVFTVPHTGTYIIVYNFYFWINNSGPATTHSTMLYHNSTGVQEQTWESGSSSHSYYDNTKGTSFIMNMSTGDTFKFSANADIYGGSTHTTVCAYMLG